MLQSHDCDIIFGLRLSPTTELTPSLPPPNKIGLVHPKLTWYFLFSVYFTFFFLVASALFSPSLSSLLCFSGSRALEPHFVLALGFSAFFCSTSRDQAPIIIFGPYIPVSCTPSRPHFRVVTFGAQPPTTCWLFGCFNTFDFHSSLCFLVHGPKGAAFEFVQIRVAKRRARPQKRQGAKKRQGAAPKQAVRLAPPPLSLPSPKVAGHGSPKRIRALRPLLQKKGGHAPLPTRSRARLPR